MDALDEVAAWLDGLDAAALRTLLLKSVTWHGHDRSGGGDPRELVGGIEDAVGVLEARIDDGDQALVGLIDEVIVRAEQAIAEIHDSDGIYAAIQAGSVSNFVFKAVLIHPALPRQGGENWLTVPSPG